MPKPPFFLSLLTLCAACTVSAQEFREKDHLLLYSGFEDTAIPSLALNGTRTEADGTVFTQGKSGKGIHFDKTNPQTQLRYRLAKPLNPDAEWTIAFWLRPDNASATNKKEYSYLFRTDHTGGWADGNILAQFCKWGQMRINRFDSRKKGQESNVSASLFPGRKWTHFALAGKQGKIILYINGNPASFTNKNGGTEVTGTPQHFLRLGAIDKNPASRFEGTIDELKVFSRALTADQVKLIMDSIPGKDNRKTPLLQLGFNGRIDCISSSGAVMPNAQYVVFRPGVIGKGAAFVRHGYDRAGRLTISDVNGCNGNEISVSFFFIPGTTDAADSCERGLVSSRSGNDVWQLFRQGK